MIGLIAIKCQHKDTNLHCFKMLANSTTENPCTIIQTNFVKHRESCDKITADELDLFTHEALRKVTDSTGTTLYTV